MLLDVLQQRLPDSSKTTLRKMLQGDRVRVNGAPERDAKREIGPADRVDIAAKPARLLDPRVRIVFEDNDLIVIDKAAGLLTVATAEVLYETAEAFLNQYLGAMPDTPRVTKPSTSETCEARSSSRSGPRQMMSTPSS